MTYHERERILKPTREQVNLVHKIFPKYKGRTIYTQVHDETQPLDVRSYWSGGYRDYFVCIDTKGNTLGIPQNGTPFDGGPIASNGVVIPNGYIIAEHSYMGTRQSVTIHRGIGIQLEGKE